MVKKRWMCLALILLNAICFGHVCFSEFINLDDPIYITNNPYTLGGLSWANIRWAFGDSCYWVGFWIPLTWLSLELDGTLFGIDGAWGFHLVNLLFHLANVTLLFLVLDSMTKDRWRSAITAALYSLHPLRVESVAWVTERKDVLSAFFLIVAMGAYYRYSQAPGARRYVLVFLAFLLGLMAKPILVTFPFALLLLDYWPLGRLRMGQALLAEQSLKPGVPWGRLVVEKIPFFTASALFSLITVHYASLTGAMASLPLSARLAIAFSGYVSYVEKTFWPTDLAAMYPLQIPSAARVACAAIVLGAITLATVWMGRRIPALPVGWLWFVGTLFPVSGISQTGPQAFADRFTYVPHIGFAIMIVWGIGGVPAFRRLSASTRRSLIVFALAGLGLLTWIQVLYWQNSGILFEHALSVTEKNFEAHYCVSDFSIGRGDLDQAERHAAQAVEIEPMNARGHFLLGMVLVRRERYVEAATHLQEHVRLAPNNPDGYYVLGLALCRQGRWQAAKQNLQHSVAAWKAKPQTNLGHGDMGTRQALAHTLLAEIALHDGFLDEAVEQLTLALGIKPDLADAPYYLGIARGRRGDWPGAEAALLQAVTLEPRTPSFRGYLAAAYWRLKKEELARREYAGLVIEHPDWLEQTSDRAMRSITRAPFLDRILAEELALQICEATSFKDARWLNTLAAVQAAEGQFDTACATTQKALGLTSDRTLRSDLENRLRLYEQRQALPVKN
jgi:Flp pilus assembly protein TadD